MDAVALLLDHDVDAHRLFEIDAVVVDEALGLEAAVLPFGEGLAQPRLRQLEQAVEAGEDFRLAVFGGELVEPPLAEPVGAELAADVAEHQLGRAAVGGDDALDVVARLVAALIAHGGRCRPSLKISRAWPEQLPGTGPPMSLLCAIEPQKPNSSPSTKTGVSTHMSGACGLPP